MKTCLSLRAAALLITTLFCLTAVAAERKLSLEPERAGKGASGELVIADKGADRKELRLSAAGLKANGVYTLWLVNPKPKMDMAGVGEGPYMVKAGADGKVRHSAEIATAELARWELFELAYHPDGNPENMSNIEIVLKTKLK